MQQLKLPKMNLGRPVSTQLKAIAELRWRMFVNGLRSRRGKTEFASRMVVSSVFALGGVGGFLVASFFSYLLVSQGKPEYLAVILWPIFFFWQFFPVMATAFTNNPDSTELLRFPLSYRSYFMVRMAFGFFDPACAIGSLGLLGVWLGVTVAQPLSFVWTAVVLAAFGIFNLLLMQMVFAWLERWLAQRRTREIFGLVFILLTLSLQLIGPIVAHLNKGLPPEFRRAFEIGSQVQAVLPPGLASDAIAQALHARIVVGLSSLALLAAVRAGSRVPAASPDSGPVRGRESQRDCRADGRRRKFKLRRWAGISRDSLRPSRPYSRRRCGTWRAAVPCC